MDDVPVEQDSAQKIAVFELQYMTMIAEDGPRTALDISASLILQDIGRISQLASS